jgi:hypothetical protein
MFGALAQLVAGAIIGARASSQIVKQADEWFRLTLSLTGTGTVAFLGIFGAAGGAALAAGASLLLAIATALFTASSATAAIIYALWRKHPLTKGIPIMAPMKVAKDAMGLDTVYIEPSKSTGGK